MIKIQKNITSILTLKLLLITFVLTSCNSGHEFTKQTDDYFFELNWSYHNNPMLRKSIIGDSRIEFTNSKFEDVLSGLLNIDSSYIFLSDESKNDLIINASYINNRENYSLQQSQKEFLTLLEQGVKFSIEREFAANTYYLAPYDTSILRNFIVPELDDMYSKVFHNTSSKNISFENAGIAEIVRTLNIVYDAHFVASDSLETQYSFEINGVMLEDLKNYLEESTGFTLLPPTNQDFPQDLAKPAIVTFR